jgi:hypothetical protein
MAPYGIVAVEAVPVPDRSWLNRQPREYRFDSPDRSAELRIHSPFEFAMGAESWTADLRRGRKVLRRWEDVGYPATLAPWSHDGRRLVLPWFSRSGNGVVAANADGSPVNGSAWPANDHIVTVQWAMDTDRLVVVGARRCVLLDGQFEDAAVVGSSAGEFAVPSAGWLPGRVFWLLGGANLTELRFHDGRDGSLLSEATLDPAELLPYDSASYRGVPRDRYSLDVGPGHGAVGALLDQWVTVEYDRSSSSLTLGVFRPTSRSPNPPLGEGLGEGLPVEERRIRVRLG